MNAEFLASRNIYKAYVSCRRRKRNTANARKFDMRFSQNIVRLTRALQSGKYTPGKSICFVVRNPKPREVFAADFKERIVHHLLVEELEKYWEKIFIFDSFACRKGKGNLAAVERVAHFMRSVTDNGRRRAFFLQIDIASFFMSIDKAILWQLLKKGMEKQFKEPGKAEQVAGIAKTLLFHDPTKKYYNKAKASEWKLVPDKKSLFHCEQGKGLPIGNLTSQFFANVYLNELDQYAKHTLKIRCYVRYVDDIVVIHESKNKLAEYFNKIKVFLREKLKLKLKPAVKLAGLSCGINFLGYVQHVFYRLPRRRVLNNVRNTMQKWDFVRKIKEFDFEDLKKLRSSINSYLSYMAHASAKKAVKRFFQEYSWVLEYFKLLPGKVVLKDEIINAEKQRIYKKVYGG
ncbi:reverse transcriptase [bacterium]|nr:reverse transcriptase [bacterium]